MDRSSIIVSVVKDDGFEFVVGETFDFRYCNSKIVGIYEGENYIQIEFDNGIATRIFNWSEVVYAPADLDYLGIRAKLYKEGIDECLESMGRFHFDK